MVHARNGAVPALLELLLALPALLKPALLSRYLLPFHWEGAAAQCVHHAFAASLPRERIPHYYQFPHLILVPEYVPKMGSLLHIAKIPH